MKNIATSRIIRNFDEFIEFDPPPGDVTEKKKKMKIKICFLVWKI